MSNYKNVEAFNRLIGICTGYGGTYVPGSPNLRVENLFGLLTQARAALLQVSVTKTSFESATNQREVIFEVAKRLSTRILAELKSCGAMPQTVTDAAAMVRKINARVKSKPELPTTGTTETEPAVNRPRVNGSGYASVIYHMEKLISTLEAEPKYNPAIPELQGGSLKQMLLNLRATNEAVVQTYNSLSLARGQRNQIIYGEQGSVYDTARKVKQQIRSIFGFNSQPAIEAGRIKLTLIKQ